jgi:hypothetical protein
MSPSSHVGERSKRFLSFGIKRIAILEEEIKEYLSLSFARQSILQLRHNNWQDSQGFVDSARNIDVASFVRAAATVACPDRSNTWANHLGPPAAKGAAVPPYRSGQRPSRPSPKGSRP